MLRATNVIRCTPTAMAGVVLLAWVAFATGKLVAPSADAVYRDGGLLLGEVDQRGEFRCDHDLPPVEVRPGPMVSTGRSMVRRILNANAVQHRASGPVYEYRSGRLIPGIIDADGYFVPDLGGGVIAVEEYDAKPNGRPVYNRPLPPIVRIETDPQAIDGLGRPDGRDAE